MAQPVIQTSFNSGEWAPALNARVDLTKYHTGAALLRNFFVDYRGGATARSGTRYILQTFSTNTVRLIPFQASFTVTYMLEFGDGYIRFINNGAPVLETGIAITGATQANPCVVTVANTYTVGDWVFISGVAGMTQLNGNYYIISARAAGSITLQDLFGNAVNATAFGAWTSGGTVQRVYKIASPYVAAELAQIKFCQNVNTLILTHPNHAPQQLILTTATSWALSAITIGATISAPTGQAVATTIGAGTANYAYVITAVDSNGQESAPSAYATLASIADQRTNPGSMTVTWSAVTGAQSYNVYKAEIRYATAVPVGAQFGFIGNCTGLTFIDSNITQDFSLGPPVVLNPFNGTGVQSVTITTAGSYGNGATIPTVSFTGGGGSGALGIAFASSTSTTLGAAGRSNAVGDVITLFGNVLLKVTSIGFTGDITSFSVVSTGSIPSGTVTLTNPYGFSHTSGGGSGMTFNTTYGISSVGITNPGTGYGPAPTVVFSSGAAAATAVLGAPSSGNPTVPGIYDQRLILAGPVSSPQQFNFSQPGAYYNFNVTNPVQPDNAFQGTLASGQLNTIKALVPQPSGLIALSDKQAWLINGGSAGIPVSATGTTAHAQAYNGAADPPPIVATNDILYVQAKGSIVRDLVFNFYTQIYTGTDISVLSSHLFYGFQILEWAWAEEPFKVVWAVRNDGLMLTLTFLKEQELIAWAHSDTQGAFSSVATVTETVAIGPVDAVYTVVKRMINGQTLQYIERFTELFYPTGATDAWCVDAGIQYNGVAALTFTGAQPLSGAVVTGLATDDKGNVTVITPFTMGTTQTGTFTLPAPPSPATGYTRVTLGLSYLPQLQTLALDLGEPTVQGKRKKIQAVTVRCKETLGLSAGRTFDAASQKVLTDLVVGNLNVMTNSVVTDLVTGDARIILDPLYDVPGQYCIQQSNPYPASILGAIPEIVVGDTK